MLIEMHDPVNSSFNQSRFAPIYYGHYPSITHRQPGAAPGFDFVWAFELMWNPWDDLLGGRAISLYYYNLAYSLPLYNHIDLRTDNRNALVFWWNASTCRHLGIGGTHPDPAVGAAHHAAMKTYRRLKPVFTSGDFYGIDEMTHVHVKPDGSSAVVNCFNLEDHPIDRTIHFDPSSFGMTSTQGLKFSGSTFDRSGAPDYVGKVSIPALGHSLIEVSTA